MKTIQRCSFLVCGLLLLQGLAPVAYGWGDHYLITDQILEHPEMAAFSKEMVKVESLDDFLKAQPNEVAGIFDLYYLWLASTGSKRFKATKFDTANPTTAEFLRVARLNPKAFFPLVERMMPGDTSTYEKVSLDKVTPYLTTSDVFVRNFRDVTGQEVTARSVLRTFVDEPDWGIDHDLWSIKEYGYGEQPYGDPTGETSKAPFHVKFQHENGIVNKFASDILEGMTLDRMEMFTRLAKVAFSTGHPYWGYRFTAWSMHYIEDLAQPYHSKAVPGKGGLYYFHFVISPRKKAIKTKTTKIEGNRHFLYEDFVSYTLQQYYTDKDPAGQKLAANLQTGDATYGNASISPKFLQDQVTLFASDHARTIDKIIAKSFDKKMTKDPKYDQQTDKTYNPKTVIAAIPADKATKLQTETGKDFTSCSAAARAMIFYTHGK
jgi:hypothetical protein